MSAGNVRPVTADDVWPHLCKLFGIDPDRPLSQATIFLKAGKVVELTMVELGTEGEIPALQRYNLIPAEGADNGGTEA